jgi:D-amino peptidase
MTMICTMTAVMALAIAVPASGQLKVYISADLEGVAGVVSPEQLGPTGFEYGAAREWMTAEVLAAIQGARDAGATEILVSDSHGNGQNLLIDRLPPDVRVIRSWPRPLMMMEGIDSTFDAAIFIGYHSATTNPATACVRIRSRVGGWRAYISTARRCRRPASMRRSPAASACPS